MANKSRSSGRVQQNTPAITPRAIPERPGAPPFLLPGNVAFGQQVQVWQSQYPPPEAVERFEAVLPGSFDRILTMVERAQQAQIDAVEQVNRHLQADTKRGVWLGFVVAMGGLFGAGFCAYFAQPWVAGVFLGIPVLGLVRTLVTSGSRPNPKTQSEPMPPRT